MIVSEYPIAQQYPKLFHPIILPSIDDPCLNYYNGCCITVIFLILYFFLHLLASRL